MADARESKSAFGIPLIVGAIGFGLAAALMAFIYLKSEKAALLEKYAGANRKEVTVLVAAKDLPKGTVIREEMLSQRRIPAGFVSNDAIPASAYKKYLGRVIEVEVGAGKPLLTSYLDTNFPVDFSDIVPVGRRAMTVQVDDLNSIAGFVRPGNHIDLFVTIPSALSGYSAGFVSANMIDAIPSELRNAIPASLLDAARSADTSDTTVQDLVANALPKDLILPVLQNVRVLATGRDPYREELDQLAYPQPRSQRNFNTVTLDLSPREAALVTAAIKKGDLLAVLRNRKDKGAADFSTVSAQDLFGNAFEMAKAEDARRQRVAVAKGLDQAGNLVDADGNTVMTQAQLTAAGLTVNAKGELVDKNGKVIKPDDIVVTADGRVMQKSALAAAGLSVNEAGQIVDANGKLVAADDVITTPDGKVLTRQQLAAANLSVNENGEIVDASGRVVDTKKMVVTPDGRVLSKEQLAAAGLAVNDKGEIVDASGKAVDAAKLVVGANGAVMQESQVAKAGVSVNAKGQVVTADGRVLTREQLAAAGLKVNAKGEIVDASGKVVDPAKLAVAANGAIVNEAQLAAAGLSVNDNGQLVDASGKVVDPSSLVTDATGKVIDGKQLAAAGLRVDERGQVVDAAGNVVDAANLVTTADGTLVSAAQLEAAGLKIDAQGQVVDADGRALTAAQIAAVAAATPIGGPGGDGASSGRFVGLIIGGAPTAGVAKSTTLKVTE